MSERLPELTEPLISQSMRIIQSYYHWTGRELISMIGTPQLLAARLLHHPAIVISHGAEPDPILNYGNRAALMLWEMSWKEFTTTPSRLTAEPMHREERARLLAQVTTHGYMEDYQGIRISRSGRRFLVEQATVWNLLDENGNRSGQAATFDRWDYV